MGSFTADLALEEAFYLYAFRPYLEERGIQSVFLHAAGGEATCEVLQRKRDIDVIGDDGTRNTTWSLKTVRGQYSRIFWETISNTATGSPGWGIYSRAARIIYSMGLFEPTPDGRLRADRFRVYVIDPATVRALDAETRGYATRYGYTHGEDGRLLYRSAGLLIPLADFDHGDLGSIPCTEPVYTASQLKKEAAWPRA